MHIDAGRVTGRAQRLAGHGGLGSPMLTYPEQLLAALHDPVACDALDGQLDRIEAEFEVLLADLRTAIDAYAEAMLAEAVEREHAARQQRERAEQSTARATRAGHTAPDAAARESRREQRRRAREDRAARRAGAA